MYIVEGVLESSRLVKHQDVFWKPFLVENFYHLVDYYITFFQDRIFQFSYNYKKNSELITSKEI